AGDPLAGGFAGAPGCGDGGKVDAGEDFEPVGGGDQGWGVPAGVVGAVVGDPVGDPGEQLVDVPAPDGELPDGDHRVQLGDAAGDERAAQVVRVERAGVVFDRDRQGGRLVGVQGALQPGRGPGDGGAAGEHGDVGPLFGGTEDAGAEDPVNGVVEDERPGGLHGGGEDQAKLGADVWPVQVRRRFAGDRPGDGGDDQEHGRLDGGAGGVGDCGGERGAD